MISKRAHETTSFIVMDILERAEELEKDGKDVIHLEVGQPDFKTPEPIVEATIEALQRGDTGYTHSLGLIELREAIAEHYFNYYDVNVSPDQILVTSGSSPAMLMAFHTLLEAGDEFILPNPYYSCYPNFILGSGAKAVLIDTPEDEGFEYDTDQIKRHITSKTRGLLVNSPANPTGIVYSKEKLMELGQIDLPTIISDEIYHGLTYEKEDREYSLLEFCDHAIIINGFSKLYAMTGWRLGYLIAPKVLMRPLQRLQQNYIISANSFVQRGGIAALQKVHDEIHSMKDIYNKRRKYMIQRLKGMGFTLDVEPQGAFYVFANAKAFTKDSRAFAFRVLEETYVGIAPGIDFGTGGEGYLRFSYANSMENIEKGLDRLEGFLHRISDNDKA
ncbi:MAG TPA: pyridoxal phosphate-dependent aminotransferase [Spirochaetes bacterium]|nr:pyridoxal phosphate-dependent aminotransferase [Spirochaetota bacterium]